MKMLLLPLLLGLSLAAGAQSALDPAACLAETDDARRLACYDQLHGRKPVPVPAPAPARIEPVAAPLPAAARATASVAPLLSGRWDLDGQRGELFAPRVHRPVYLLPISWTSEINQQPSSPAIDHQVGANLGLQRHEAKFQLSLKSKLAHRTFGLPLSLWAGYTQSSRWQLYNGDLSRPFRETNYEPEIMAIWPLDGELLGWRLRFAGVSFNHQSNGRALPLSRSWNRVIGMLAFERGEWVAELRPWVRLPENAADDDNPDILDHIGRGELRLTRYWGDHSFALQLRHSLRSGGRSRGSGQLEWAFPVTGLLHGYLQVFSGYGESLIDYNIRQQRIGLGVTIAGWR